LFGGGEPGNAGTDDCDRSRTHVDQRIAVAVWKVLRARSGFCGHRCCARDGLALLAVSIPMGLCQRHIRIF
jgi:hypothetical protein